MELITILNRCHRFRGFVYERAHFTLQRKEKRQQFIHELLTALPIHPITVSLAIRVGQIDGENQAKGIRLPLADLLIGVTALALGYSLPGQSNPTRSAQRACRRAYQT
jgi:predicted nucleic acid-binding protein